MFNDSAFIVRFYFLYIFSSQNNLYDSNIFCISQDLKKWPNLTWEPGFLFFAIFSSNSSKQNVACGHVTADFPHGRSRDGHVTVTWPDPRSRDLLIKSAKPSRTGFHMWYSVVKRSNEQAVEKIMKKDKAKAFFKGDNKDYRPGE